MGGSVEGRRKGGLATYKKHPEIFAKGRVLGVRRFKDLHPAPLLFDVMMPITPQLAELTGAFIGDGFTNRARYSYLTQVAGHKTLDRKYLTEHVATWVRSVCPEARILIRDVKNKNAMSLNVYSKSFFDLWTERFKMPSGKKCYTVKIPDEILRCDEKIINACLRGIFDTDGCLAFDRRAAYRQPYIRILLQMSSPVLLRQVHHLLHQQSIDSKLTEGDSRLQINGRTNCLMFIQKIGFTNERHKKKIPKSLWGDLNSRPAVYETAALTAELQRRSVARVRQSFLKVSRPIPRNPRPQGLKTNHR